MSRRNVLKLGAVAITCDVFTETTHASDDVPSPSPVVAQGPAPVPTPAPANGSLAQGVWLWQHTGYADGMSVVCSDPRKYTLTFFTDEHFDVQADCNHGSGTYTVAGSGLTLQPGPMTQAACPPGSQDTVFMRDLGRVATHVFDGENLVLNLEMDSGNMVFSPQPPVSLTGPAWQVLGVNNGRGAVASVLLETQLDATFSVDGIVSGSTGCNAFRGLYTAAEPAISFGALITTRRPCPSEEATGQEQAFLAALGASTRYELRGDHLTLRDDAGAAQVDLVRSTG